MQIFTWYQYVWNSWSPFTFRLKPNWEQPNYLSETQRGSGRQLASHKSPKRILTIHKKFEIFTPLQMLPDSWFTLQLLSELCENMLLQSRSWLCILFLPEQYFPHQEKEVIVLSLALEEVIGGTLFCSQSQVSRQSDVLSQKSQVSSLTSFECQNQVLQSWKLDRFTDIVYCRTLIIIYVSTMVMWYNDMTTREKYILLLCWNTKSIQNTQKNNKSKSYGWGPFYNHNITNFF